MSLGIRGQETAVKITVDGVIQKGSYAKLIDFEVTPRTDLVESDFLGEDESDLDTQHHGFDMSFSVRNEDAGPLDLLTKIVDRQRSRLTPPRVTITKIYNYREPGAKRAAEVFDNVHIKIATQGSGGRKEYEITRFEGKCKRRGQISA